MIHKMKILKRAWILLLAVLLLPRLLMAETHFVEAETFTPSADGWKAFGANEVRRASRAKTMWGADGSGDAIATKSVTIQQAGKFNIWVRWMQVSAWRGPFRVSVSVTGREVAAKTQKE